MRSDSRTKSRSGRATRLGRALYLRRQGLGYRLFQRLPLALRLLYEKVETLRLLDGLVDIYLPDLKYVSADIGKRYSNAPDYFEVASSAIREMFKQVGKPVFETDSSGQELMKKGIIVRHLVLPEGEDDSKKVLAYLHETYGDSIYISIMNQYTPMGHFEAYPELNRKISDEIYDRIVDYAIDIGIENGFIQEGDTAKESFIPVFDGSGL